MRRQSQCPHWRDDEHLDYVVYRRAIMGELGKYGLAFMDDVNEGVVLGGYEARLCPGCNAADIAKMPA